ncbi:hypothetical protein M9H77_27827 [Catharanthus roseus]|uniref:Uncharacterized protein n=1 Tax=Catharanthus roseus TaxID=4058 RepID=A0ACC0AE06_CATRO|nr:hypothetical protein M9H77_27827 [Catharanthus roseus]
MVHKIETSALDVHRDEEAKVVFSGNRSELRYGLSLVTPEFQSEFNTYYDIFDCLKNEYGIKQKDVILYGLSVGSGPMLHLASPLHRLRAVFTPSQDDILEISTSLKLFAISIQNIDSITNYIICTKASSANLKGHIGFRIYGRSMTACRSLSSHSTTPSIS